MAATVTWNQFKSTIANELSTSPDEIKLSYRFSSFTATENAEVLYSQDHFQKMISKAMEFLTGRRKVRGGQEFCVLLNPVFERALPTTAETSTTKKSSGKVNRSHLQSLTMVVTS